MSKIGVGIKNALQGSQANYFDTLCDNLVWQNVTNVGFCLCQYFQGSNYFPIQFHHTKEYHINNYGADPDNANEVLLWSTCGRAD